MADLGDVLCQAVKSGQIERVKLADDTDLNGFRGEPFKCHENAERWSASHADTRVIRGWLITAQNIFVKHSVVRTADGTLLDVTPRVGSDAQRPTDFIVWSCLGQEEFVRLPPQVIHIPAEWLQAINGSPEPGDIGSPGES